MSMLDNLAQQGQNDWLSQKLDDNPEQDEALQTTARIVTAHIWPFLASSISDDDYRNRRGVKEDEVRYVCATIAPHMASALVDHVLAGFDADYAILKRTAQEELLAADELLPALLGGGNGGGDSGDDDDGDGEKEPQPWDTPKLTHLVRQSDGDPNSPFTLFPKEDEDEEPKPFERAEQEQQQKAPKPWETPKADAEIEPGQGYYSIWGPWSQQNQQSQQKAASPHQAGEPFGSEAVPFDMLNLQERAAHISHEHQVDPATVKGMSALGSAAMHQVLHDEGGLDIPHYHPNPDVISVDHYGHINLGAKNRYYPYPHPEAEDPDPDREMSEAENRGPESDVYHGHDEPEYEADWERPSEESFGGHYRGGVRERQPRTSAKEKEEKGTVPCPICHKKFEPGELAEHMKSAHHVEEDGDGGHEKKPPGSARAGQSKAKPSAGRQTHKPARHSSVKEARLVRSHERPPEGPRRPAPVEMGYDPEEAFPGYYGATEAPIRGRTAQAPLTGQSDVPSVSPPGGDIETPSVGAPPAATPTSNTGASGMFDPTGAGGASVGDFSQSDAPQDIQSQLGQLPTLGHRIGAKLTEMAAEVLSYNPDLSAVAAMEVALQAVRLYPKVASGGADYMAEPGTEGVPTEVLTECPQCQWQAYNRSINRCHNCGFYDAGLEAEIEVT